MLIFGIGSQVWGTLEELSLFTIRDIQTSSLKITPRLETLCLSLAHVHNVGISNEDRYHYSAWIVIQTSLITMTIPLGALSFALAQILKCGVPNED